MSENNNIWNLLLNNEKVTYDDLEKYIYRKEYIEHYYSKNGSRPFKENEYNKNLYIYFFAAKEYTDYDEIFFQHYLDGDITKEEYFKYENNLMQMFRYLFEHKTYLIYDYCTETINDNGPAMESLDVLTDFDLIEKYRDSENYTLYSNFEFYKQICYMGIREIATVTFLISDLKAVIEMSGLHGLIICENKLDDEVFSNISKFVHFEYLGQDVL